MNKWKPMIYFQTKSDFLDTFLPSGSLCSLPIGSAVNTILLSISSTLLFAQCRLTKNVSLQGVPVYKFIIEFLGTGRDAFNEETEHIKFI